ncbi:MAG: VOC family protein [Sphingobium sp.]
MSDLVDPTTIRAAFARAMSAMYRAEVPRYGELIEIVEQINDATPLADPAERQRIAGERHGAIRVGTAQELGQLARAFAVMGMAPVGYYDLSAAGVPVHSTAFRPIEAEALAANPFRMFTSLLRLELIADEGQRRQAETLLAGRRILSDRALELTWLAEVDGGLGPQDAEAFVAEILDCFRWHAQARVDRPTYDALSAAHRLIADVVCFKGPHINHLTPRTLDIDAAQAAMQARGLDAKAVIEGPPRRAVPILLRQTSFKALEEPIRFLGEAGAGTHTARFGEIEQRGLALTPKGRALYDDCLTRADFADFPDDMDRLRREGLGYFRYVSTGNGSADGDLGSMIAQGRVRAEPLVYEDFLPVSAAGIFQSNLGDEALTVAAAQGSQAAFEAALGMAVLDAFALYAAEEAASIQALTR